MDNVLRTYDFRLPAKAGGVKVEGRNLPVSELVLSVAALQNTNVAWQSHLRRGEETVVEGMVKFDKHSALWAGETKPVRMRFGTDLHTSDVHVDGEDVLANWMEARLDVGRNEVMVRFKAGRKAGTALAESRYVLVVGVLVSNGKE